MCFFYGQNKIRLYKCNPKILYRTRYKNSDHQQLVNYKIDF